MLHLLLVSARQETLHPLAEGLAADPEVRLDEVSSGAEALRFVSSNPPQLAIIDFELPDREPLPLVRELLTVNAMVNTAVVSPLTEEEFHEASEGLGILARLPVLPRPSDAVELLCRLRQILGLNIPP
jgi:DNA-binding response OmpR family regulator